ncbi:prepilin peptidase, partial [Halobiforma nitratireducens]
MTLGVVSATGPDLLRLVALPVFAWVAIRDIKTRRVSSGVWIPLALLGGVLLVWEGWTARAAGGHAWTHEFLVPAAISLGVVVPIAYLFWWFGGFGGADAKALLVLALLFPTFPEYAIGAVSLPVTTTPVGAFSFTVLTNAVLVAIVIPIVLAVRNAIAGRIAPVMFIGWPVAIDDLPERHGRLLETPAGVSRGGLDLDALRMYLRWRGLSLADIRENGDLLRDPATLPEEPNPPTDGAVTAVPHGTGEPDDSLDASVRADDDDGDDDDDEGQDEGPSASDYDDPWGADAFLADIDGTAYGTAPADLREG